MAEINEFIKKRPTLIWYTKNYDKLPAESIVEAVLNYGNWHDVRKVIKILGIKKVAEIFKKEAQQTRKNLRPEIIQYFDLYFKKHA